METKISFEQFLEEIDINHIEYLKDLNDYLLNNGYKATFESKKSGLLGSYKHVKSKKVAVNLLLKKHGLRIRIYGENSGQYLDFLNTLPEDMVELIAKASDCKRLIDNTCSPKCNGYDVVIKKAHFQKCRYGGFEFPVTEQNSSVIRTFVENEIEKREEVSA